MTDDRELLVRRRRRQRRIEQATGSTSGGFFSSPLSAIFCMLVALGSILAFWQGVPSWVLLIVGIGAILLVVIGIAFIRMRTKGD